jgi:hypothetical protein
MNKTGLRNPGLFLGVTVVLLFLLSVNTHAIIDGISGTTFDFVVKEGHISTPDGNSVFMWGYANGNGLMQYPGPTLIVNQGDQITIYLTNGLSDPTNNPVSIVFPGHNATATGGSAGLLTLESTGPSDTVTYTFTATHAGTYLYHSGTRPELQIEMGLVGAIIVTPNVAGQQAYEHLDTAYDYEYLFLLTEIDPQIHEFVELNLWSQIDNTAYHPVYWMINGRAAPDTMLPANYALLPYQPYNCMPRMHPGDKLLMRVINAGRDLHPFHHHGNNSTIIARDGRVLASSPGVGPDLGMSVFTIQSVPGKTVDSIFEWTGKGLGWDMYGHSSVDPTEPDEYLPDHGKPFPVLLPEQQDITPGGAWSGSPFLGNFESLPPGEGGLNLNGGFFYMWHSHTEKEMVNFDIFPGGMMTMFIIEPLGVTIP